MVSINSNMKCEECGSVKFITDGNGYQRIKKRLCKDNCSKDGEIISKIIKNKWAEKK